MKLDCYVNPTGKGKYALIKLREIPGDPSTSEELAAAILANPKCVDFGEAFTADEFFLLRLKDIYAMATLSAYAKACHPFDPEFAAEVRALSARAGLNSKFCKQPD